MGRVQETVAAIFIERVKARRDAGDTVAPWKKPWDPALGMPRNLISGKPYRGSNVWMTMLQGYQSPYWVTLTQARNIGCTIKKDAEGKREAYTPILFWKFPTDDERADGKRAFCRFYQIWNAAQVDGIHTSGAMLKAVAANGERKVREPIEACEALVAKYSGRPEIVHGGGRACYSPSHDRVQMPDTRAFPELTDYYHTLFHELAHSTGHRNRLDRDGVANPITFASHAYSEEELIAEMAATMLAGHTGIGSAAQDENAAAYLDHWLGKLEAEPSLLFKAGTAAQKAVDHIQGISWEAAK